MPKAKKEEPRKEKKVKVESSNKRLVRSKTDKIIAGVCGGLGEYFNIDPIIIRVLFAFISISGGSGLLLYIILWIVMPERGDENKSTEQVVESNAKQIGQKADEIAEKVEDAAKGSRSHIWVGLFVVVIGLYFTLGNLGITSWLNIGWVFSTFWPLIIILVGFLIIINNKNGEK